MIGGIFSRLARVQFTVGYVAILLAISCAILALGPHAHDVLVQRASTNLHNLAHGHVGTLLGSALVVDAGPLYFWLPFLTCLLALAELHLRTIRLVMAFLVGHVGATLVVAAALAAAVKLGWMPISITRASDVGMSYGALAVLGAMTAVIPQRWRAAWVGWWVAAGLASAIIGGDFTDAGHSVAVVLGVLVSARFRLARSGWTWLRYALLGVGASFGFLMMAHGERTTLVVGVVGLLGAVAATGIAHSRMMRRRLPAAAAAAAPEPALNG